MTDDDRIRCRRELAECQAALDALVSDPDPSRRWAVEEARAPWDDLMRIAQLAIIDRNASVFSYARKRLDALAAELAGAGQATAGGGHRVKVAILLGSHKLLYGSTAKRKCRC